MNLNNFHKHISQKIYERGEEYYEYDSVNNVEHDYPGTWKAEVEGSDLYSVEIKLNGDEIVSWECDCPYDYGDICKHVVAVLLYIKDNKDKHPDLHPQKNTNVPGDYTKEIQKCFHVRNSYDNYGYSHEGESISIRLGKYIEKAKSLIKLNCEEEALTILLHIIKKIGDDYEEFDDYNGDLACVCQEASEIIAIMIKSDLPDNLLKVVMDELSQMIKNRNYDNYSLADLNQILFSISLKTSDFEKGIAIIDEALKTEPDSFRTFSLVTSKIELLEQAGKREEVKNVISHYLYLPEVRKIKLKELISEKQYEKALLLIDEGISLAEKKEHPGTVNDWKDEKLTVFQWMNNKEKIIELAEDLFVNGRESMKYYRILKTVISTEKWASYLDNFLLKSGKHKKWGIGGHVLAQIYIAEEYWDRLMEYVEKNIQLGKYNSLGEYESYLKPRYPERMLVFYRTQITDYAAKNMGREHYKYIADVLKAMKNYPGGTEIVNSLLVHFKSIYSNRRAMMEELGK
jgi:tetratricopeptide (TPR) repeat protein